jgi:ankyrin repeat protein
MTHAKAAMTDKFVKDNSLEGILPPTEYKEIIQVLEAHYRVHEIPMEVSPYASTTYRAPNKQIDASILDAPCAICQTIPAKFKCGKCKSVNYCSAECQKFDWKHHKRLCDTNSDPLTGDANVTSRYKKIVKSSTASLAERFFSACSIGRPKAVESIMAEAGSVIDLVNISVGITNNSCLNQAVFGGHLAVTEILLKSKANPNSYNKNGKGFLPLHLAAKYAHVEITKLLILHKADVNLPLQLSKQDLMAEGMAHLTQSYNNQDTHLNVPLHFAAQQAHLEVAQILVSAGANIEAVNHLGDTPLILAVQNVKEAKLAFMPIWTVKDAEEKEAPIAALLLEKGANVSYVNPLTGSTAINYTCSVLITKLLISAGADVNHINIDGSFPLHAAAGLGHVKLIKLLLSAGAHAKQTSKLGSALDGAVGGTKEHREAVQALLRDAMK